MTKSTVLVEPTAGTLPVPTHPVTVWREPRLVAGDPVTNAVTLLPDSSIVTPLVGVGMP